MENEELVAHSCGRGAHHGITNLWKTEHTSHTIVATRLAMAGVLSAPGDEVPAGWREVVYVACGKHARAQPCVKHGWFALPGVENTWARLRGKRGRVRATTLPPPACSLVLDSPSSKLRESALQKAGHH